MYPKVNLLAIANETLHDIATSGDECPGNLTSVVRVCRTTSAICAYVRYTSIYISETQGQALLATLLSGSSTSNQYTLMVKRIWLEGGLFEDMDITTTLFSQAVAFMDNLISIVVTGDTIDPNQFVEGMRRNGLIRESRHPAFTLTVPVGKPGRFSKFNLPWLRSVRISADAHLLRSVHHRPLTELIVDDSLSNTNWASFMDMVDGTILSKTLTRLSLKLSRTIDIRMAMFILSETFPLLYAIALQRGGIQLAVCSPNTDELPRMLMAHTRYLGSSF